MREWEQECLPKLLSFVQLLFSLSLREQLYRGARISQNIQLKLLYSIQEDVSFSIYPQLTSLLLTKKRPLKQPVTGVVTYYLHGNKWGGRQNQLCTLGKNKDTQYLNYWDISAILQMRSTGGRESSCLILAIPPLTFPSQPSVSQSRCVLYTCFRHRSRLDAFPQHQDNDAMKGNFLHFYIYKKTIYYDL